MAQPLLMAGSRAAVAAAALCVEQLLLLPAAAASASAEAAALEAPCAGMLGAFEVLLARGPAAEAFSCVAGPAAASDADGGRLVRAAVPSRPAMHA